MKKAIILGFASSRMKAPLDQPDTEIWGCNEGYVIPPFTKEMPAIKTVEDGKVLEPDPYHDPSEMLIKPTRWFQLHSYVNFSRHQNPNDVHHYQWMKNVRDFPIYMQRRYPNIPMSQQYPIDEIIEDLGGNYFTSSFAYMIAMAIYEKYDWIGLYGFEMAANTEYFHQRPNAEYLIGIARGRGLHVELPEGCNLLRGRMYAYEDESIGFRQQLEMRRNVLTAQLKKQEQTFFSLQGRTAILEEAAIGRDPILESMAAGKLELTNKHRMEVQQEMINASALANTINGARMEADLMIQIFDGHNGAEVADDILKKEIE